MYKHKVDAFDSHYCAPISELIEYSKLYTAKDGWTEINFPCLAWYFFTTNNSLQEIPSPLQKHVQACTIGGHSW